jgi:hypothetical protein
MKNYKLLQRSQSKANTFAIAEKKFINDHDDSSVNMNNSCYQADS